MSNFEYRLSRWIVGLGVERIGVIENFIWLFFYWVVLVSLIHRLETIDTLVYFSEMAYLSLWFGILLS